MTSRKVGSILYYVDTGQRKPSKQRRKEDRTVRLTVDVDEATWRALRDAAEETRPEGRGKPSLNKLLNRVIAEYLATRPRRRERGV